MPLRTRTRTAAPPVTSTEVAVLGLLTDGERSGYDLLRAAEQSVGFFWTPAKTQLYAALRKLVENGFATSRRGGPGGRAGKKPLLDTPTGERAGRRGLGADRLDREPEPARAPDLLWRAPASRGGDRRPRARPRSPAGAPRRARADRADVRPRAAPLPVPHATAGQGDCGCGHALGRA